MTKDNIQQLPIPSFTNFLSHEDLSSVYPHDTSSMRYAPQDAILDRTPRNQVLLFKRIIGRTGGIPKKSIYKHKSGDFQGFSTVSHMIPS